MSRTIAAWSFVRTSTATSPGDTGPRDAVQGQPSGAVEQADDVGRDVLGDDPARDLRGDLGSVGYVGQRTLDNAEPKRWSGVVQPNVGVRRVHVAHGDPLVAQRRAPEHRPERGEQWLVAAPVAGERAVLRCRAGRVEVRDEIGAAEGVNRLLWVADEHQGRRAVECGLQDPPLQRVGVLELVDQHHPVPRPDPLDGGRSAHRVAQRVVEPTDKVVVVEQTAHALAPVHLSICVRRQGVAQLGRRAVQRVGRHERRLRITDRRPGHGERGARVDSRFSALAGEPAQVQVADHLDHQVIDVLDERGVRLEVAGHAETGEHLHAKAVRGRYGRGVERGERSSEPVPATHNLGVRCVGEQRQYRVGGVQTGAVWVG